MLFYLFKVHILFNVPVKWNEEKGENNKTERHAQHHFYNDEWLRTENKCVLCVFIDANWITWFECKIDPPSFLSDGLLIIFEVFQQKKNYINKELEYEWGFSFGCFSQSNDII